MPTIAQLPSRVSSLTSQRLTMWILGAILVAVVATTLAVSLIGSGGSPVGPSADAPQGAPQAQTPLGGALP
jgi:hypothetical protein